MKILLTSIAVVGIAIVVSVVLVAKEVHSPCDTLKGIANDPKTLSTLFDRLTFYYDNPTFLSQYESINSNPTLVTRFSTNIDHGLGIDWEALGIDSDVATFSYKGESSEKPLDYRKIKPEQVSFITVGHGARFNLIFEIDRNASDLASRGSTKYDVKVECHK
jgi:hypothetical protein